METLRDLISAIANEVYSENLLPERAVDLRRELSALYGNILDRIQITELLYNKVLLQELDNQKVAAKAKITAQTTPQYQEFIEAKNTKELVQKMMSSLSTFIRSKEEEFKTGKY